MSTPLSYSIRLEWLQLRLLSEESDENSKAVALAALSTLLQALLHGYASIFIDSALNRRHSYSRHSRFCVTSSSHLINFLFDSSAGFPKHVPACKMPLFRNSSPLYVIQRIVLLECQLPNLSLFSPILSPSPVLSSSLLQFLGSFPHLFSTLMQSRRCPQQ